MEIQKVYTPDEIAERAKEMYESRIRRIVEADNIGRFLAIDVTTGDYTVADQRHEAAMALRCKNPNAQIWGLRIGHAVPAFYGTIATVPWPHDLR